MHNKLVTSGGVVAAAVRVPVRMAVVMAHTDRAGTLARGMEVVVAVVAQVHGPTPHQTKVSATGVASASKLVLQQASPSFFWVLASQNKSPVC